MSSRPDPRTLALLGGAHVHLPDHLAHMAQRGWSVSAVFDREAKRRARLCHELGARSVADLTELGGTGCMGAVVCSETAYHEEDVLAALDAGFPVFCEKPLAPSAASAWRCAARSKVTRGLLHTGYFLRTNPALQRLKAELDGGAIGQITHARLRFSHDGGYADWLDLDCWMTHPDLACFGGFVDEAVHVIDLAHWLVGPVRIARALTGNSLGWPVDDHGAAIVCFECGATGTIEAGWTDFEMRLELDITGTLGRATVWDGSLEILGRQGTSPPVRETLAPLDAGDAIDPFLDALEGRKSSALVSPEDAARVNEVLELMGLQRNPIRPAGR